MSKGSMHAVVVNLTVNNRVAAERELRDQLVPWATQIPGFVAGYWTIKGDNGLTMILFESEDAANRRSERAAAAAPSSVTLESVDVRDVVAHA